MSNKKKKLVMSREMEMQIAYTKKGERTLDSHIKKLLGNKCILSFIMKRCCKEYHGLTAAEIVPYIEGNPQIKSAPVDPELTEIIGDRNEDNIPREGAAFFDILFHASFPGSKKKIGLIINLEAQRSELPDLVQRSINYSCRLINKQKNQNRREFHYGDLVKVYSIWLCIGEQNKRADAINRYRFAEDNLAGDYAEPPANYDLINIYTIGIAEYNPEHQDPLIAFLGLLLFSEKTADEKITVLEKQYQINHTEIPKEELTMSSVAGYLLDRYVGQIKAGAEAEGEARGRAEGREEGRAEGREEGRAEGREEGRAEGEAKGILNTLIASIQSLMETADVTLKKAMDLLRVPEEQRPQIIAALS